MCVRYIQDIVQCNKLLCDVHGSVHAVSILHDLTSIDVHEIISNPIGEYYRLLVSGKFDKPMKHTWVDSSWRKLDQFHSTKLAK